MQPEDVPSRQWLLDDWYSAANCQSNRQLIAVAEDRFGHRWSDNEIGLMLRKQINEYQDAVTMIGALTAISARNGGAVFRPDEWLDHARLFLISEACQQPFALLDEDIARICGEADLHPEPDAALDTLRRQVIPRPPNRPGFFGRDEDLRRVRAALEARPVTVIDSVGGDGKTALAWFALVDCWKDGRFRSMSWVTDKRVVITLDGSDEVLDGQPLDLSGLLNALACQFGWNDILGLREESRLVNACADRLRAGHYLVVVDNLETMSDAKTIVETLNGMVVSPRASQPSTSRVLVTSRKTVSDPNCASVSLSGIDPDTVEPFVRYLEKSWQAKHPLTAAQCQVLARDREIGYRNPLFIQILVRRCINEGGAAAFDEIITSVGDDPVISTVFRALFKELVGALTSEEQEIAQHAAFEAVSAEDGVICRDMLFDLWAAGYRRGAPDGSEGAFADALEKLKRFRVLNVRAPGEYTMHSLVREYLYRMETPSRGR